MRLALTRSIAVLAASASMVFAVSCSKSPTAPSPVTSSSLAAPSDDTLAALGGGTNSTPEFGKIKICKAGNVNGTFTVAGAGGTVTTLPNPTVPTGACWVVAEDSGTPATGAATTGANITITETSAGLQSISAQRVDLIPPAPNPGGVPVFSSESFSNGGTLFVNNYHGHTITFTNNIPPPQLAVNKTPDGGVFTQGAQVSFTIVVSNPAAAGSQSATNVTLTDALPGNGGLVWATASTTQGTCVSPIVANNLSCSLGTIAPGGSVTVLVTSTATTPAAACTSQPNPAAIATSGSLTAQNAGSLSCTPPPPPGNQGCTPGFWKQEQHFDSWPAPYLPSQDFDATFGVNFFSPNITLLQAAGNGGGGLDALGRHAVAALLGSASGGVDYPYSTAQVLAIVRGTGAFAGQSVEERKNLLAAANELGCPLN